MKCSIFRNLHTAFLGLLLASGVALGAQEFILPNGSKVQGEIQNNRLMLLTPGGVSPAPDGQYRLEDGRMVVVQNGIIIESTLMAPPGARAISPKLNNSARGTSSTPVDSGQLTSNVTPRRQPFIAPNNPPSLIQANQPATPSETSSSPGGFVPMQPIQMQSQPMAAPPPAVAGQIVPAPPKDFVPMQPVQIQPVRIQVPHPAQVPTDLENQSSRTNQGGTSTAPPSSLHAAVQGKPKTLASATRLSPVANLELLRGENRRLHAMVEDLQQRIALGKENRKPFCSDYAESSNKQGVTRDCTPFACNPTTGECYLTATTSADCAAGFLMGDNGLCESSDPLAIQSRLGDPE